MQHAPVPPPSPAPPVARVLHPIAVLGLLANVAFFVVAMAFGGVEGNTRRAAGALVASIVIGNGVDGLGRRFGHQLLRRIAGSNAGPAAPVPSQRLCSRAFAVDTRPDCIAPATRRALESFCLLIGAAIRRQ